MTASADKEEPSISETILELAASAGDFAQTAVSSAEAAKSGEVITASVERTTDKLTTIVTVGVVGALVLGAMIILVKVK